MKAYNTTKKEVTSIPFQLVYEQEPDSLEVQKSLAIHSAWLLPQILAYIGNKVKPILADGKYNAILTIKEHIKALPEDDRNWFKGLILFTRTSPRGTLFAPKAKATSADLLPYAANVPLFLAAFKKFQDIKYEDWDKSSLASVLDKGLYDAVTCEVPEYTVETLIDYRTLGSTIRTGEKAGQVKNPVSATSIISVGDPIFDKLPRLTKLMLCQCWVYHPSFWNDYMILNVEDWDAKPEKLIQTEVIKSTRAKDDWDI